MLSEKRMYWVDQARIENEAYNKSLEALGGDISLDDFVELYGQENVERDKALVIKKNRGYQERDETNKKLAEYKKWAIILEGMIFENAELSNWFGDNASTNKTSRYDDIVNGVDMVMEFDLDDGASHLALGVDVTFSPWMEEKLQRIKDEINKNQLAKIKYFQSENLGFKGQLEAPRVVIGIDIDTVKKTSETWIDPKQKKEMAKHEIQLLIIEEIRMQLEAFRNYAEKMKKDQALINRYNRSLGIIEKIQRERRQELPNSVIEYSNNDQVFRSMKEKLEGFDVE